LYNSTVIILIHYAEIGLKGKNRPWFEKKLVDNIRLKAKQANVKAAISRLWGRIVLETDDSPAKIHPVLAKTFGLAWFAPAYPAALDLDKIKALIKKALSPCLKKAKSFAVRVSQAGKTKLSRTELEIDLGDYIRKNFCPKVNLSEPEITVYLEVVDDKTAFLFTEKIPGPGGLPVGTGGKAICLLSGGIDSPVAGYLALSRGVNLTYLHFHSYPKTSDQSIQKVKKLIKILARHQPRVKLYLAPFLPAQTEIIANTNHRYLVILYRRLMLKIAAEIVGKEKAQALVTGDSLGQVASQTIENIALQDKAVSVPIVRPLITNSKEEIISLAKKVGTYLVSIQPHQDTCSLFLPKNPVTKGRLEQVIEEEKKFNTDKLIKDCLEKMKIVEIS